MKKAEIKFSIELDEQNIPEKIFWEATENPNEGIEESKAISLSVWDQYHKGTLKIDLWTKEMDVNEMKRFCIETLGGLGESLVKATGDQRMADEIENLCQRLTRMHEEDLKKASR